jgi:AAA15 family ATPase/GTPase
MLENIHIQNFRCFEDFKAEGFERINLIGGKNNSGKTCLLEAIACLSLKFGEQQIVQLREPSGDQNFLVYKNAVENILSVSAFSDSINHLYSANISNDRKFAGTTSRSNLEINYINQKTELPTLNILGSFDEFDSRLIKDKLIKILQVVDSRIEDMRTFNTKQGLYIKLKNSDYEPLSNFGDATKNLIRYFTPIFEKELLTNNQTFSILLIDEIENGIHYSAHYDFWKNVFKLSKELNVQIFATTHSLEMIQQFNKVAKEEGEAAYFEMGREYETGKIFAQKHDTELLEYELEKPTSTVRG